MITGLDFTPTVKDGFKEFKMALGSSIPEEKSIPEHSPISNQLASNSCTANASMDALELLMGVQGKPVVQLSRLFAYFNARRLMKEAGSERKDAGTYIYLIFESLQRFGVCSENTWNFDLSKVNIQPPMSAYEEAFDNRITCYFKIQSVGQSRIDAIISAININHPVVFGTGITKEFTSGCPGKIWTPTKISSEIIGGHAMCVVGYRKVNGKTQFKIRNSWSTNWGDHGYTWFDEDYMKWAYTSDLWVLTTMPNLI
jgi:C1A family cysteine protease